MLIVAGRSIIPAIFVVMGALMRLPLIPFIAVMALTVGGLFGYNMSKDLTYMILSGVLFIGIQAGIFGIYSFFVIKSIKKKGNIEPRINTDGH